MRAMEISKVIQIPEDIEVVLENKKVTVEGAKGKLTNDFSHTPVSIDLSENELRIWTQWPRKKEAATVGTVHSLIRNMIIGAGRGFTYKLKIVYSHFPISVKIQNKRVLIENFTGERSPRRAKIVGDVKVKIQNEDVIVQGIKLEDVSQTSANIEQATKIKKKDPRVFLDGIYVYERHEGLIE